MHCKQVSYLLEVMQKQVLTTTLSLQCIYRKHTYSYGIYLKSKAARELCLTITITTTRGTTFCITNITNDVTKQLMLCKLDKVIYIAPMYSYY